MTSLVSRFSLKIFALDFDIEGLSVLRFFGVKRANDWLQINNSGERMFGTRSAFTLLFDDVIEASLMFKSDFANSKRPYNGFLLYFIGRFFSVEEAMKFVLCLVTPIRGPRPSTTSTQRASTLNETLIGSLSNRNEKSDEQFTSTSNPKAAALFLNERQSSESLIGMCFYLHIGCPLIDNVGLTLLVVLLSGILFVIVCAFLLYKR